MTDTPDTPRSASLDDVVAALADLTAALRPALAPATRPTWNQQRWSPAPDAFGDPSADPLAVDPNGYPTPVAADELIESAWGNATVAKLLQHRQDITNERNATGYASRAANLAIAADAWGVNVTGLFTTPVAGTYWFFGVSACSSTTNRATQTRIRTTTGVDLSPWVPATCIAGGDLAVPIIATWNVPAPGNYGVDLQVIGSGGGITMRAGSHILVVRGAASTPPS